MTTPTRTTRLGKTGPAVFPISLGCMSMAGVYGASDDAENVATIRHAVERGVTLLDTGDFYGMGATVKFGALDKPLSAADVAAVEALLPPDAIAGTRYAPEQMKHLDSER